MLHASANCQIKIESLHEFGLLCHLEEDLAAFSPDAIAGIIEETPGGRSNICCVGGDEIQASVPR